MPNRRHPVTDDDVAEVLRTLKAGPQLATALPKLPDAIMLAEEVGLVKAVRLEHNFATRSVWRWAITPSGKLWLKTYSDTHYNGPRKSDRRGATYLSRGAT